MRTTASIILHFTPIPKVYVYLCNFHQLICPNYVTNLRNHTGKNFDYFWSVNVVLI